MSIMRSRHSKTHRGWIKKQDPQKKVRIRRK